MEGTSGTSSNLLTPTRLFLAVLVLCSHSYPLLYGERLGNAREPLARLTGGQITGGTLAVSCFFAISGYLIAASWCRSESLSLYLSKRIRRIYPGFIVASIISVVVVPLLAGLSWREALASDNLLLGAIRAALLNAPIVSGLFATAPFPEGLNGSLWTIQYEWVCYLLIAALGLGGLLRRPRLLFLIFAAVAVATALQWRGMLLLDGVFPPPLILLIGSPQHYPRLLAAFFGGVLCYHFPPRSWLVATAAALTLIVAARLGGLVVALPLAMPYLLLRLGLSPVARFSWPRHWPDLSYGIYLYAFPVQQLLVHWRGEQLNPVSLSALALLVVCPLAALSWYLVERPWMRGTASGLARVSSIRSWLRLGASFAPRHKTASTGVIAGDHDSSRQHAVHDTSAASSR